jgi:hypothetical protein
MAVAAGVPLVVATDVGAAVGVGSTGVVGQLRGIVPTAASNAPHSGHAYRPGAVTAPHSGQAAVFVAM